MTPAEARATLEELLQRIAPDVDLAEVPGDALLQVDLELDSMDVLNLVAAVHDATGIEVPERDFGHLATLDGFARYLAGRAP